MAVRHPRPLTSPLRLLRLHLQCHRFECQGWSVSTLRQPDCLAVEEQLVEEMQQAKMWPCLAPLRRGWLEDLTARCQVPTCSQCSLRSHSGCGRWDGVAWSAQGCHCQSSQGLVWRNRRQSAKTALRRQLPALTLQVPVCLVGRQQQARVQRQLMTGIPPLLAMQPQRMFRQKEACEPQIRSLLPLVLSLRHCYCQESSVC
mmetsp:Transcript_2222/g.4728  ORF Transcript_2222/g.4728 Transcript_2222/m.4728 type:complete len:201 (+) Transcript_2222:591-1193(+)